MNGISSRPSNCLPGSPSPEPGRRDDRRGWGSDSRNSRPAIEERGGSVEEQDAAKPTSERHVPVLKDRCINLLAPGFEAARKRGATPVAIDATLGMGGHSEAMLQRFPDLHLVGIDRDEEALALAGARLEPYSDRTDLVHAVYDEIEDVLADLGIPEVHGILMDLGVSSLQLDERERGFAYSYDAPLDMRMDTSRGQTAADVVNNYSEDELVRIIRKWGEEKFAGRIANRIVNARADKPFATTGELVEQIRSVVPAAAAKSGGHPAKRTFQALRIEVNEELDVLERAVPAAVAATGMGGRIVVMSYHSLEDKIVKSVFQTGSKSSAPLGFPVELEEHKPDLKTITKGTEVPTAAEIAENPRAASARLRAVERIKPRRDA
ncbi:16S rRNA (cytosine(1402)-N(4))-methyltransferase RsmH [Paenarthrobacter sp. CM16]|nr:16S rRNA (cytosine(1402)-N(4))-methyltransferase RsmH [Paenarthrobacter sp. CM16]